MLGDERGIKVAEGEELRPLSGPPAPPYPAWDSRDYAPAAVIILSQLERLKEIWILFATSVSWAVSVTLPDGS